MKPNPAAAILAVALALALCGLASGDVPVGPTSPTRALFRGRRLQVSSCTNDAMCSGATNGRKWCCFNGCADLQNDPRNCGACRSACKYNEVCCSGRCVNLSYDVRHCGACNRACLGHSCVRGMCDYA